MLGTDSRDYFRTGIGSASHYKGNMDISTIAEYRWNTDTSVHINGSNNWTTSELNMINLNINYWNYLGAEWQSLIATTIWHLGGSTSSNKTTKVIYDEERNNIGYEDNPTTFTDEIGLMYVSDYGYAASPDYWTTGLVSYGTATSNNWMYMGLDEWPINPYSSDSYWVFLVFADGHSGGAAARNMSGAIRPVFYIQSSVLYSSGDGSINNPYRIEI